MLNEAAADAEASWRARVLILEEQQQELLSINEKWAKEYRTMRRYFKDKTCDLDITANLLKSEVEELQTQNGVFRRKVQHQREEIQQLKEGLEDKRQTAGDRIRETLQLVWKHQAEVNEEDFLKERADREKLKETYEDLRRKFRKVQSELLILKSQVTRTRAPQVLCACSCRAQGKYSQWEIQQISPNDMQIRRRITLENQV